MSDEHGTLYRTHYYFSLKLCCIGGVWIVIWILETRVLSKCRCKPKAQLNLSIKGVKNSLSINSSFISCLLSKLDEIAHDDSLLKQHSSVLLSFSNMHRSGIILSPWRAHKDWNCKFQTSTSADRVMFSFNSGVIYITAALRSLCDCARVQLTVLCWRTLPFAWPAAGVVVLFPAESSRDNDRACPQAPNDKGVIRRFFFSLCAHLCCVCSEGVTKACSKAISGPTQAPYDPHCTS